jgi:hypothetical protein
MCGLAFTVSGFSLKRDAPGRLDISARAVSLADRPQVDPPAPCLATPGHFIAGRQEHGQTIPLTKVKDPYLL